MDAAQLPRARDAVLTTANVSNGQMLIRGEMDLGELSQVITTVIDDDAVHY